MTRSRDRYAALPSEEDPEQAHISVSLPGPHRTHWLLLVCAICTMVNLVSAFHGRFRFNGSPVRPAQDSISRPNQFIGLDMVNYSRQNEWLESSLVNQPLLLVGVDEAHPHSVLPIPRRQFFSGFGTVETLQKYFFLNATVHAIVQFRVRDFGMEQCQLHLNLPDLIDPDRSANRSLVTSREATFVDVWRLDSTRVIAAEALSFATRPVRRELIVRSMPGGPGSALTSRRFPCPSDSLQTFEFTCVAPTCMLSFWQDGGQPVSGVYMTQHSTLSQR